MQYFLKLGRGLISVFESGKDESLVYYAKFYFLLGRFRVKVKDANGQLLLKIVRGFNLFRWKTKITISFLDKDSYNLFSLNAKHSIYEGEVRGDKMRFVIHNDNSISIFKNQNQVARTSFNKLAFLFNCNGLLEINKGEDLLLIFALLVSYYVTEEPKSELDLDIGIIGRMEPKNDSWNPL